MVCAECRNRRHENCPGGTWCDCQHHGAGQEGQGQAEPMLTWLRQG